MAEGNEKWMKDEAASWRPSTMIYQWVTGDMNQECQAHSFVPTKIVSPKLEPGRKTIIETQPTHQAWSYREPSFGACPTKPWNKFIHLTTNLNWDYTDEPGAKGTTVIKIVRSFLVAEMPSLLKKKTNKQTPEESVFWWGAGRVSQVEARTCGKVEKSSVCSRNWKKTSAASGQGAGSGKEWGRIHRGLKPL